MSRHERTTPRRTFRWPILCAALAVVGLLIASPAEARAPKRKKNPVELIIRWTAIDNEGPIAMMPIDYARRAPRARVATPTDADLDLGLDLDLNVAGPMPDVAPPVPPATRKTRARKDRTPPENLMGPFPRR